MTRLLTPLVRLSIAVSALATAVPSLDQRDDAAFVHPGIMMSKSQLNKMRSHVEAGSQPWADAYAVLEADDYASPTHEASPVATVVCGSYSNPDVGCTDERDDATAAYTNALAWYATGDQDRADKAIELMNAWSSTIQWHNDSNAPLQSGWAASVWTRAAEIIRHTGAGWDADDVAQFEDMLNEAYLPLIIDGSPRANGNWELGEHHQLTMT